ncbi:MAG: GNAT family N-acetyltransferase [Fimbriimonadaceae bacterium]
MEELLLRLQTALIETTSKSRRTFWQSAFTALISPEAEHPGFSYAIPTAPLSDADVNELISIFRGAGKMPRLEFFPRLWPGLGDVLSTHGFKCEGEYPLMILSKRDWAGATSGISARLIGPDEAVLADRIAHVAFEMQGSAPDGATTAAGIVARRITCAIAQVNGHDVSTGFGIGDRAIREIAGIATLPEFRRKGAATAVLNCLLTEFFDGGGDLVWLSAGDDGAKAAYAKVGFIDAGVQANWSRTL